MLCCAGIFASGRTGSNESYSPSCVCAFVCVYVCVLVCMQEYLPVEGLDRFLKLTSSVIFGKDSSVIKQGRYVSVCLSVCLSVFVRGYMYLSLSLSLSLSFSLSLSLSLCVCVYDFLCQLWGACIKQCRCVYVWVGVYVSCCLFYVFCG